MASRSPKSRQGDAPDPEAHDGAGAPDSTSSFEAQLEELDAIVQRMESGELTLEESLREFERGQKLARACQKTLEAAQQRVRTLLGEDGDAAEASTGRAPAQEPGPAEDDDLPF